MVLLPYMNWGNLKLFLRQCKLVEANNPQVPLGMWDFVPIKLHLLRVCATTGMAVALSWSV